MREERRVVGGRRSVVAVVDARDARFATALLTSPPTWGWGRDADAAVADLRRRLPREFWARWRKGKGKGKRP